MSSHFGDTVERCANFFGSGFTLRDIRNSVLLRTGGSDTILNDSKIRYHLKRLGYKPSKYKWIK